MPYAGIRRRRKVTKKEKTNKEREKTHRLSKRKNKININIIFDLKIRTKRCYVKKQEHIFSEHYISKIYLNRIPSRFHLKKIGIESLFYCARRTY